MTHSQVSGKSRVAEVDNVKHFAIYSCERDQGGAAWVARRERERERELV